MWVAAVAKHSARLVGKATRRSAACSVSSSSGRLVVRTLCS